MPVEATAAIRLAVVGAALDMIERSRERFGLYPEKLVADTAYGSAETLSWLVESEGFEPRIPVNRRESPIFCVSVIQSMLSKRSKDDDNFQRTAGRTSEGL